MKSARLVAAVQMLANLKQGRIDVHFVGNSITRRWQVGAALRRRNPIKLRQSNPPLLPLPDVAAGRYNFCNLALQQVARG